MNVRRRGCAIERRHTGRRGAILESDGRSLCTRDVNGCQEMVTSDLQRRKQNWPLALLPPAKGKKQQTKIIILTLLGGTSIIEVQVSDALDSASKGKEEGGIN